MSKAISAEFLASMRAQFPALDPDAGAAWIATLAEVDNPETMLSAMLAKGKFAKGHGSRPQAHDAPARGTLGADGGWDRNAAPDGPHGPIAARHARHCAAWCATPADAAAYLAACEEYAWYAGVLALWAGLGTPLGWQVAPCSNTAQRWAKDAAEAALLAPQQKAPEAVAPEALLLRDWTQRLG